MKHKRLKYLFILLSIVMATIIAPVAVKAEQKADKILAKTANKIKNTEALSVSFTMDMAGAPSTRGQLTMSGKQFKLTTPGMTIWFDGTTQWTYIAQNKEVNITAPTADELAETNPFEVITNSKQKYDCHLLSSTSATEIIDMRAKSDNSAVKDVLITIDKQSGWPHNIVINFDNGSTTTLIVNAIAEQRSLPEATFKFDNKQYKNIEIIDLR